MILTVSTFGVHQGAAKHVIMFQNQAGFSLILAHYDMFTEDISSKQFNKKGINFPLFLSVTCPAGQYRQGQDPGSCLPCPINSYRGDGMDMRHCESCGDPAVWTTLSTASTSISDCISEFVWTQLLKKIAVFCRQLTKFVPEGTFDKKSGSGNRDWPSFLGWWEKISFD